MEKLIKQDYKNLHEVSLISALKQTKINLAFLSNGLFFELGNLFNISKYLTIANLKRKLLERGENG